MPSFLLDRPASGKDTYIMVQLTCTDGVLRKSIKEKISPERWDFSAQRPRITDKKDKAQAAQLIKIGKIYQALTALKATCAITEEALTKQRAEETLLRALGLKTKTLTTFEQGSHTLIEEMKAGAIVTPKGKKYSLWSIKHFNHTRNALLDFAKKKNCSVEFKDTTLSVYNKFIEYCNEQQWALNTVGMHIKNWKRFLLRAKDKGWHKNDIAHHKDFKILSEETFDVFLSQKELDQIIQATLSGEQKVARDWFVVGCYTALRISDLRLLDERKVFGAYLVLMNEKTDERVEVPIHPHVRKILTHYKGFPPKMSDVEINKHIKDVAKDCGLKDRVLYSVTEGGERKDYWLQKWQMVSLHTARRSFITNASIAGMPDIVIMKLAGIRSAKTLERYKKLSQNEAAKLAAEHAFFKA
jgi:integrase